MTNLNGSKAGMLGYGLSLVGATVKTVALQVATMALNAAITMGASVIVSGIVTAISNWIRQDEILAEKAENAKQKINELNNEYKTHSQLVSDSAKRYAELAQSVDQQAFDKLVSEYLNYSDALIKLDETNKDLYIKQLKSVGVSNAQALVEERLTANYIEENNALEGLTEANKEEYIAKLKANNITNADVIVTNKLNAKKEAENTVTKELNMTMDEFLSKSFDMQNSLLGEANASDICRGEIAQLQLAEILVFLRQDYM